MLKIVADSLTGGNGLMKSSSWMKVSSSDRNNHILLSKKYGVRDEMTELRFLQRKFTILAENILISGAGIFIGFVL